MIRLLTNSTTNACLRYCLYLMYFVQRDMRNIRENVDIMIISVSTYAYIQRGGCSKAVAVNLVAAAVHPSAYDNRHTRSCPKINVQLCKRNESPVKEGRDIRQSLQ